MCSALRDPTVIPLSGPGMGWSSPWVLITQLVARSSLRVRIRCYLLGKASLAILEKAGLLAIVLLNHPLNFFRTVTGLKVISLITCPSAGRMAVTP